MRISASVGFLTISLLQWQTVSMSSIPQPGGPVHRIYNHGGRVVQLYPQAPGTHFSRLWRRAWTAAKFLYLFHSSQPLVRILSQMNPVHTVPSYWFETYFNVTLPTTLTFFKWAFSFRFSYQNPLCIPVLFNIRYIPYTTSFSSV